MNFAFDYAKHKSKPRNDGFYFNIETPRGHFFTVLDFAPHDYANLNPSLQGKLETIVSSFVSVSSFSADLFLGFLAKEINNFVHNLAEQSGGPELFCSAALCLVSGDRLSYFLRGDTKISILQSGRLQPLHSDTFGEGEQGNRVSAQLGAENLEAPMSDQVQAFTLEDDDVVLVMTRGVAEAFESQELRADLVSLGQSDSQSLCDSLMKASAASSDHRTLVVISGPYERQVEPSGLAELSKAIAALEARLNALTEREQRRNLDVGRSENSVGAQFEQFGEQVAELKDYLKTKAATIDLLELDEKVNNLSATLAGKANTAEVLGLQRDVLKLGIASNASKSRSAAETDEIARASAPVQKSALPADRESPANAGGLDDERAYADLPNGKAPQRPLSLVAVLLILALAIVGAFIGAWLQAKVMQKRPEIWSVKSSGHQILISRLDGSGAAGVVSLNVAQPLRATGEQTFSSFADVKQYIDTITKEQPAPNAGNQAAQANQPTQTREDTPAIVVTEIAFKSGDTLKKLAQRYKTTPRKLIELNPNITRWSLTPVGQKIVVPSPSAANSSASQKDQSASNSSPANTTRVTIEPGDTLDTLARRYNLTVDQLKKLNPQITNWSRIQSGQKVLVTTPAGG